MIGLPSNVYFSAPGEDDPKYGRLFIADGDWWLAVNVMPMSRENDASPPYRTPDPTSEDWDEAISEALVFLQRMEAER